MYFNLKKVIITFFKKIFLSFYPIKMRETPKIICPERIQGAIYLFDLYGRTTTLGI